MIRKFYRKKREDFLNRRIRPELSKRLNRSNIYIVPSKAGGGFLLVFGIIIFAAINYQNNSLYLLAFSMLAIYLLSILATFDNLNGLEIRRASAELVQQGDRVRFNISLMQTRRANTQSVVLAHEQQSIDIPLVNDQPLSVSIDDKTQPRGISQLGRFRLETRFPFGMTRAWCYADVKAKCYVYPAPSSVDLRTGGGESHQQNNRRIESDEFVNIRPWQPGESPKRILWPAYARTQELLSLEHEYLSPSPVWLDYDQLEGPKETRLSQLAYWVLQYSHTEQPFALKLPNKMLPVSTGEIAKLHALTALASFGFDDD